MTGVFRWEVRESVSEMPQCMGETGCIMCLLMGYAIIMVSSELLESACVCE